MAISATAAAATRYQAGASLLPVTLISQVATKGAVPPKIVQSAERAALLAMLERFSVGP